uniref:Uncharacterized protein n=1 Tax=Aotus nancymaae TaxID=37293 RepID=A0A2K5EVX1_AOTNA
MLNVRTMVLTHACCGKPPSLPLGEICGTVAPKMLASHNNKPFLSPNTMQNTAIPKTSRVSSKYVTFNIYVIIWGRNDHVKTSYVKVRWRE